MARNRGDALRRRRRCACVGSPRPVVPLPPPGDLGAHQLADAPLGSCTSKKNLKSQIHFGDRGEKIVTSIVTDAKGSGRTRQRYSDGDGDGHPAAREDPRRERATYQSLRPCCVRERRDETRRDETWERGPRESRAAIGVWIEEEEKKKKLDAVVVTSQEHDTDHLILTSHSHLLRVCCFPCYCLGGICEVLCDALTLVFCCPCRVCCGCPELSADRR